MAITIEDGFYLDPETNRTFYVKKGMVPPWVKSKPEKWKRPLGFKEKKEELPKFNAHDYEDIYKDLKINLDTLGCVMLDLKGNIPEIPDSSYLYKSSNPLRKHIDGFVAGKTPHVTLLYGLLESAQDWKEYINQVLKGWELNKLTIKEVGFFESPYKDDPYYCIVAHIDITPKLMEGRYRLQLLPHIDTFPGYKAHFSLAYVKKDIKIRDFIIKFYNSQIKGKELEITGLNFGYKKEVK